MSWRHICAALLLLALLPAFQPEAPPGVLAALDTALAAHNTRDGLYATWHVAGFDVQGDAVVAYLAHRRADVGTDIPGVVDLAYVLRENGTWRAYLPTYPGYGGAAEALPPSLRASIDATPYKPAADPNRVPTDAGYGLPWLDGQFATVTRSYGQHGRGRIDFDLTGTDVAAVKDGVVVYADDQHSANGAARRAWWTWNTVIVEHGPQEYTLYGHLAPDSLPAAIAQACAPPPDRCRVPVQRGDVIGREGNTGWSSNPHLHIEFGQAWGVTSYLDGGRLVMTAFVYAQQNAAFEGYTSAQVAAWPYGRLEQASHGARIPRFWNVVRNHDFAAGTDGWRAAGQLSWALEGGALHVFRLNTSAPPAYAAVYQDSFYGVAANTLLEASLTLGNTSGAAKTVRVEARNASGATYGAFGCDFVLPPGAAPARYSVRGTTESTWANARLWVAVNTPDGLPAVTLDDVRFGLAERDDAGCSGPF